MLKSNVSRSSSGGRDSAARISTGRRPSRHGCDSSRLSAVLKSGILAKRGKILDLIDDKEGMQSRTFLNMKSEDEKMLKMFDLDYLYVLLFATIWEDTMAELNILATCNNALQMINTCTDMAQLVANKYGIARTNIVDELDKFDRNQLDREEYKLKKLVADRRFFQDTVLMTYLDLVLNRSFESFAQQLAVFHDKNTYRARLLQDETDNRIVRRELAKQLRAQRIQLLSANYDMDVAIDHLKAEIEDSNIYAESHGRYMGKWQRARAEQHEASIQEAEEKPLHSMRLHKHKLEDEDRVHSELTLLINMDINETMEKTEKMMEKYDADIEKIDLKIQIQKNDYQKQQDIRKELDKKLKVQQKEIQEWVEFKEERERARLYRERMEHAAVVAQAWWRGLMVRLQLGPYKPAKKAPFRPNQ